MLFRSTVSDDRTVILEAKFKSAHPEFIGTFGMPNLGKLNTILNIPEYKDDAKISINARMAQDESGNPTVRQPEGIHFENKAGDFKNDYRLMAPSVVSDLSKSITFKGANWGVEIEPSVASIQRMRFQAQANNEETTFVARTENSALRFYFGDPANHSGNFTFENNISGTLSKGWNWPVSVVMNILALPGNKQMRFSDEGAVEIEVDSGLGIYTYIIPAQTK